MSWSVALFGTPAIRRGEDRIEPAGGKPAAILYYLAYQTGWVRRDDLLFLLYPDIGEHEARRNLRPLLSRLRRSGHAEGLEVEPTRLRWEVPSDVRAFREALAEGDLVRADRLYAGDLLGGFHLPAAPEFESWAAFERAELREAWRRAALELAASFEADDRPSLAAALLGRVHRAEPLDEPVLRSYLAALARAGRNDEARRSFASFEALLRREVDGEPEEATRLVAAGIRHGEAAGPDPPTSTRAPPRRPARFTMPAGAATFVGREREIADVVGSLRQPACRLLTVVAPGGMGKTRLAIEVGRRLANDFADGACFVPFESVGAVGSVESALADALSLAFYGPGRPRDQLLDFLEGRNVLLVLDNLEHLLDRPGGLDLFVDLLERAPGVTLLGTSRERLELRAEWVYDLPGLELPGDGEPAGPADSVAFFLHAARRVRMDAPPASELASVARICRLVGGMPLALEMAAGWLRVLDVARIADELAAGPDLLETSLRDLPARHHSLRGVFDTSWRRLAGREQEALRALAAFRDGFPLEAAEGVADVRLPLLLVLVNKSFLRREASGRFTQHPLLAQYLRAKAEGTDGFARVKERHAEYYAGFLEERVPALHGMEARAARDEIGAELANVRAAWAWATHARRDDLLDRAAEGLYVYFHDEGRYHDSREAFEAASAAAEPGGATAGRLLSFLGGCGNYLADHDAAQRALRAALPVLEAHGRKRDEAMTWLLLFSCYGATGRPLHDSAPLLDRAAAAARAAGDVVHQAETVGLLAEYVPDPDAAEEAFRDSIRSFEASGRCFAALGGFSLALSNYGLFLAEVRGAYAHAVQVFDEAIRIAEVRGEPYSSAWYLNNQAASWIYQGEYAEAERRFTGALAAGRRLAHGWGRWTIVHALYGLGWLAHLRGEGREAENHLTAALDRTETHGDPFGSGADILVALARVALTQGRASEAGALARRALGRYAALNLQSYVREWGRARCLVLLGEIALSVGDASGAGARFAEALAVVRRWHLLPLALDLSVSVTPFLRSSGEAERRHRLLARAARSPVAMAETRAAARRALGDAPGAPGAEVGPGDVPFEELVLELQAIVRAMRADR